MIHVETDHLGGAPCRATALGCTRSTIEYFEKAHQPARCATARQFLLFTANRAEIAPCTRAVLEEARLILDQLVNSHQIIRNCLNKTGGTLRLFVGVGGFLYFLERI